MSELRIDGRHLGLSDLEGIWLGTVDRLDLTPEARERMVASRAAVEKKLDSGSVHYGLNTGFGRLASVRVSPEKLDELQLNLVRSHAAGVGEPLSEREVRLLLAIRINTLATGYSGISPELVDQLVAFFNRGVTPVVPEKGSLGASGDLAPLAHLALVLIGEGEAFVEGKRLRGDEALKAVGLSPITLAPKDGLSLVNGTQVSTALGVEAILRLKRLLDEADVVAAMTAEALLSTDAAFDARIHEVRPHPGQSVVADHLRRLMTDSPIRESHRDCGRVQDAYSIRCTPQVQGAVRDVLAHGSDVVGRELNAATDNPLNFWEDGDLLSGGNFHGEPIGLALDYLALATAELASLSERRIERLVNPDYSGLHPFLVEEEGLNSGFMMAHVTAVSLVSENKVLAHPASVDSIPTSAGQEDHVSMSMTAGVKLRQILDNAERVLAIEALAAAQALDFRKPLTAGPALQPAVEAIRAVVPHLDADRVLAPDIEQMRTLLSAGTLWNATGL